MAHETLRVTAWDDPRCVAPLERAGEAWQARTGIGIAIRRRPLTAFNDQPLRELSPDCDVMIVDYPHMAQALAEGAILPIDECVEASAIRRVAERAVGRAQESFAAEGRVAGLASDAACHVSAWRPARLAELGVEPPRTWEEVFALESSVPGSVALALYPTDAISCLLSLLAGSEAEPSADGETFPDRSSAADAVDLLRSLSSAVPSFCWQCTPRDVFREASSRASIAFVPLTFGYVGRTAPKEGGWRFGPPPAGCGSLLGGAGMAVSSRARSVERAAAFAAWYCSDEGQRLAGQSGGQPAGVAAWDDDEANAQTDDFFRRTRATQETAWVRPLAVWWPGAQKALGEALVRALRDGTGTGDILSELEDIYLYHKTIAGTEANR